MFADADFVISTASNAQVALDKLERDDFDLMVTDMVLPGGLDGLELVKYARIRHPSLKSLFISGGAGPIQDDPDLDDFVGKPFRGCELLGCAWELLLRKGPEKPRTCPSSHLAELAILEAKVRCLHPWRQQKNQIEKLQGRVRRHPGGATTGDNRRNLAG